MKKLKLAQLVLIIIGIVALTLLLVGRYRAESSMDKVDITAEWQDFELLARQLGISDDEMLDIIRDAGFTSVTVNELTLPTLQLSRDFTWTNYKDLKENINWKQGLPQQMVDYLLKVGNEFTFVIETGSESLFNLLLDNISAKYSKDCAKSFISEEGRMYIVVSADYYAKQFEGTYTNLGHARKAKNKELLESMALGFDPDIIAAVNRHGLRASLRCQEFIMGGAKSQLDYYLSVMDSDADFTDTIMLSGYVSIAYDKYAGSIFTEAAEELKKRGKHIGLIEAVDQLGYYDFVGYGELCAAMGYNVQRTYAVQDYIRARLNFLGQEGPKEIENSLYRTITDRNIRIVLMRPFMEGSQALSNNVSGYKQLISGLESRLAQHGISLGMPSRMAQPLYSRMLYILVIYAIGSLFLYSAGTIYRNTKLGTALFLIMLVIVPAAIMFKEVFTVKAAAFVSSVFFPLLAILVGMRYMKHLMARTKPGLWGTLAASLSGLAVTTVIALAGAFFIAGLLSRPEYLLEFWYFRGVKLSLMLPALLCIPLFFVIFLDEEEGGVGGAIHRLLKTKIEVYMLIILGIGGIMALIYLIRSANTVDVSSFEVLFRIYLENNLFARPRSKEILVAFPAIVFAFYLACRHANKWLLLPFSALGMLGLSSIQNSFSHTRTPIYISFYRSVISIAISLITGIIIVLVSEAVYRLICRHRAKNKKLRDAAPAGSADYVDSTAPADSADIDGGEGSSKVKEESR